jgi:coenzyme F420-0:L-glutamate ligase/coenzyme F420-1:gamma-L-glutamate ligase
MTQRLEMIVLPEFPMVEPGDDLVAQTLESLAKLDIALQDGDVLVAAQKIFSKAENRYAYLNDIEPSAEALELAPKIEKDPRITQLILDESVEIVAQRPGAVIVEHRLGYIHANAGIDQSNITSDNENPRVLLLPLDSDKSAAAYRAGLKEKTGANVCVIINDSAGRAWRNGTLGYTIGSAGFDTVVDMVGEKDLFDRKMEVTEVAVADELAAGASFLMGQADEGAPVVLVRGAKLRYSDGDSKRLIRKKSEDLIRK